VNKEDLLLYGDVPCAKRATNKKKKVVMMLGFEAVFAIAGLLAVAYLIRRQRVKERKCRTKSFRKYWQSWSRW